MAAGLLAACQGVELPQEGHDRCLNDQYSSTDLNEYNSQEGIFGEHGPIMAGLRQRSEMVTVANTTAPTGRGINAYLWQAGLDAVAFLPLDNLDSFSGIIITHWYSPPELCDERFLMNVRILGSELTTDNLKVQVFREVLDVNGAWRSAPVSSETAVNVEDAILRRAREIRVAELN